MAMASLELAGGDGSYDFHLRSLSAVSRNSTAAADSPPRLRRQPPPIRVENVRDVRRCEGGKRRDGGAGVPPSPVMSKLFQRCTAATTQAVASAGVLLCHS
ncbi:hypothetical protein ACP70R_010911 [Stipagrostis hirtigluma subsp. patula]